MHAGDEVATTKVDDGKDWIRNIIGFDAVLKQPNMLLGWIAGPYAKYGAPLSLTLKAYHFILWPIL